MADPDERRQRIRNFVSKPPPTDVELLEEAWTALRMVRDAIEEVGPVGALPAPETTVTLLEEADVLVEGIRKIAAAGR